MAGPFGGGGFGSFIAWEHLLGDIPLQNHGFEDDGLPPERRATVYGVRGGRRLKDTGDLGDFEHDPTSRGDIISGIFLPADPKKRAIGTWRWGGYPMVWAGGGKASVVLDASWTVDSRYPAIEAALPPTFGDIPVGTPVIVFDAQKEGEQIPIAYPLGGKVPIVSQWRGKDIPSFSTIVYDITGDGKLSVAFTARLDTAWRVTGFDPVIVGSVDPTAPPPPQTLAWVLTEAKTGGGHGYCYALTPGVEDSRSDDPDTGPAPGIGIAGLEALGPFSVGYGEADPHFLFFNTEGIPVVPLAFGIDTAWHPPGPTGLLKKGNLDFEVATYPGAGEYNRRTVVHLQFDPGKLGMLGVFGVWRWWGTTAWQESMTESSAGTSSATVTFDGPRSRKIPGQNQITGSSPAALALRAARQLVNPLATVGARALTAYEEISAPSRQGFPLPECFDQARFVGHAAVVAELEKFDRPVVWREEAFGKRLAGGGVGWETNWEGPRGKFFQGTGDGGSAFMPPELAIRDAQADPERRAPQEFFDQLRTTWRVMLRTRFAWANFVDLDTGTPIDAWLVTLQPNGDLNYDPVDEGGQPAPARAIHINGRLDRNSLAWNVRTIAASANAAYGDAMECSGAGITITLPEIFAENIGQEVLVSNEGNPPTTIVGFNGTEGIHTAATSGTLTRDTTLVLRARSLTQWRAS